MNNFDPEKHSKKVKSIPSDAEYRRRKRKAARTGENSDQFKNAPASDINRKS